MPRISLILNCAQRVDAPTLPQDPEITVLIPRRHKSSLKREKGASKHEGEEQCGGGVGRRKHAPPPAVLRSVS